LSAASNGRESSLNSTSPLRTSWPSLKFTATICPSTRALTATLASGSTLPMACTVTGTLCCAAAMTDTGTSASPLGRFFSFARESTLKYASTAPSVTTSAIPAATAKRVFELM